MSAFCLELKHALRGLLRSPGFLSAVVVTLSLGMGLNASMYAVFDRMLVRPYPFRDLEGLVAIYDADTRMGWDRNVVSAPNFLDYRRENTKLEAITVVSQDSVSLSQDGESERVTVTLVSSPFFDLLRVRPLLGRGFRPEEDQPGAAAVAVLSHGFWRQRFGGDPTVLGRRLRMDGVSYEVVGVLDPGFHLAYRPLTQVFVPSILDPARTLPRDTHYLTVIGRLKSGATVQEADQDLKRVAAELARRYPETNSTASATVRPLLGETREPQLPLAVVLLSLSTFLLLIACFNASNLLLVRAVNVQHEMSLRAALGATRAQMFRRVVADLLVIGALTSLGTLVVSLALSALMKRWFPTVAPIQTMTVDLRVLGVSAAVVALALLVSALVPVWRVTKVQPLELLKAGATCSLAQRRAQSVFMVLQVGLSMLLLTGAGLMLRSIWKLQSVRLGFDPSGVLSAMAVLPLPRYPSHEARHDFARRLLDRMKGIPGVQEASIANSLFFSGGDGNRIYDLPDQPLPPDARPLVWVHAVTPGYFRAAGIPLLAGRPLEDRDPGVCLVNEAFANTHWKGGQALGRRVRMTVPAGPTYTIVGVVGDARNLGLDQDPAPQLYASYADNTYMANRYLYLLLRSDAAPLPAATPLQAALRELDPDVALFRVRRLDEVVDRILDTPRTVMRLIAGFSILGLLLAAVGLYGLSAYLVAQRTRELGIRQALGADGRRLQMMVLGHGLRLVAVGWILGLAGCLALGRFLASQLYGVEPVDPPTLFVVTSLLLVVGVLAALLPARCAARVNPAVALRNE